MNHPAPDGGGGGDYSSIKFAGMKSLVQQVTGAGHTLQSTTQGLQSQASACEVTSPAFHQIIEIGAWAEQQVDGLQRRLTLALAMEKQGGLTMTEWTLSEPLPMTTAQARAKGQALAQKLKDQHRTDGNMAKAYHEVAGDLDLYSDDPDVLSAFYASLGPQLTQSIPGMLEASGSDHQDEDLRSYSKAFGGAFKDPYPPNGFKDVVKLFTTPTDSKYRAASWDRLAMLQYGDFPATFLSDSVRANGLKEFAEKGYWTDWRGSSALDRTGLSDDNIALIFGALANNPDATRLALRDVDLTKLTKNVYGTSKSLGTGDEIVDAYGRAMEAGTGSLDESMGAHSKAASEFAFRFIQASGAYKDVPDIVKDSLGKIAASYAPELLTGSEKFDAGDRPSSLTAPDHFDKIPGVDPSFYLNQKDVYRFLHGIGSDDKYTADFDNAVGDLYNTSLSAAAAELKKHPNSAVWDNTLRRFGQLAGTEYAAQKDVRDSMDKADASNRALINNVINAGMLFIAGPEGQVAKWAWKIGNYAAGVSVRASWVKGDPNATRTAILNDKDAQAGFLYTYELTRRLTDAKYPGTEKVPPVLLDHGKLKDPASIAKDPKLIDAFQKWTDATDTGNKSDLDQVVDTGTTDFSGGKDQAENQATKYGW